MASLSINQAIALAVQHHRARRLGAAKSIYSQILSYEPQHADALDLLGMLSAEEGDLAGGIRLVRQAIQIQPAAAAYHLHLGKLLMGISRPQEALAACVRATELDPTSADAFAGLGSILLSLGRLTEAVSSYQRAFASASAPDAFQVARWRNELGVGLAKSDRLDEAILELRTASQLDPVYAEPYANLSLVLQRQGRLVEALSACRRAIELRPDFANAYNNLAVISGRLGKREESIAASREAIRLNPAAPGLYTNLIQRLVEHGDVDGALEAAHQAIKLAPENPSLHQALGGVLRDIGQLDESLAAFDRAIELDPCDAKAHSGRIFARHFHPGSEQRAQAEDLRLWDKRHALPLRDRRPCGNDPDPDRRLRIGYISPDFTHHVLAFLMLPLFTCHDRRLIETHFYSDVCNPTELTGKFRAARIGGRTPSGFPTSRLPRQSATIGWTSSST